MDTIETKDKRAPFLTRFFREVARHIKVPNNKLDYDKLVAQSAETEGENDNG